LANLKLPKREEEIARFVLKGLSNKEIAQVAKISEQTVKQYVTQIFEKAQIKSRAEFFSYIFPI
jgi:DNA-binding NarL/FixJ family response regulator